VVYNYHFSGSSLWNLFGREVEMLENSWNLSMRIMFDLPLETHRYFIESISEKPHAKTIMMKKFLRFSELILKSKKEALKSVYLKVRRNVQTYTGNNLRKIMMLMNKMNISELKSCEVKDNFKYKPVPDDQLWRIPILKEMIEVRARTYQIEGFTDEEITEMMEFVCIS
jgi:hypothetical protein